MRLDQCRVEITPVLNEHYHRLYPISIRRTKSPVQYEILIFGLAPLHQLNRNEVFWFYSICGPSTEIDLVCVSLCPDSSF